MHIRPNNPTAGETRRNSVISQIIKVAEGRGLDDVSCNKLRGVFDGTSAPLLLRVTEAHFASVNQICADECVELDPIRGYLKIEPTGKPAYEIHVDDEVEEQELFLAAIKRFGPLDDTGNSQFWTYALVIPQTQGENSQALVIAMDLEPVGERLRLRFSNNTYRRGRRSPTGAMQRQDRLANLEGVQNLEGLLTMIMAKAGFPYQEASGYLDSVRKRQETRRQGFQFGRNSSPAIDDVPPPPEDLETAYAGAGAVQNPWG
jgi:hypothetical protein